MNRTTTRRSKTKPGRPVKSYPEREAAIAMMKAGIATPTEVARLAGVSHQHAYRWIEVEHAGKRALRFDWQAKRQAYLAKQWARHIAKLSAVDGLRQ